MSVQRLALVFFKSAAALGAGVRRTVNRCNAGGASVVMINCLRRA